MNVDEEPRLCFCAMMRGGGANQRNEKRNETKAALWRPTETKRRSFNRVGRRTNGYWMTNIIIESNDDEIFCRTGTSSIINRTGLKDVFAPFYIILPADK
jgi:hypothetical protein